MADITPEGNAPDRTAPVDPDRRPARPPGRMATFPVSGTVAYGLTTAALGVVLLVWPSASLTVVAWLLAAQLALSGVLGLAWALGPWQRDPGSRVLLAGTGVLALLLAVLVAARPEQTLLVVVLLVGLSWVVEGVMRLVRALRPGAHDRPVDLVLGVVGVLAGGYLLSSPGVSLVALARLAGAFMIVTGVVLVGAAVVLRRGVR